MFTNINEEERQYFEELSKVGAKKICHSGCAVGFACSHKNNAPVATMPLVGKGTICPLAQYNIGLDADKRLWHERKAEELEPSDKELFACCAMCKHSDVVIKDDSYVLIRTSLEHICVDCPVKIIEDNID